MSDPAREPKAVTWPYTSFKTLLNVLIRLTEAVPPRIDRSFLGGSEGQKTQVLACLKFFGLIKDGGEVTPALQELATNEKDRPRLIKELLQKHYPEAVHLGTINGTTSQLAETFKGLNGETLRKAMTFYLHAAKYAHMPVSKNFKIPSGFTRSAARRPRTADPANNDGAGAPPAPPKGSTLAEYQAKYLDILMERMKASNGELDTELADRIEGFLERLGGVQAVAEDTEE